MGRGGDLVKKALSVSEAAGVIERFLDGKEHYPQEWNDFIEARRVEPEAEPYRRRCYELDPLVNRPGEPDQKALAELRAMICVLRGGAQR